MVAVSGIDFAAVDEDGTINWKAVRAAGVDFAYLNATPGNSVFDQALNGKAAGVVCGPYIFPTIGKGTNPVEQMRNAVIHGANMLTSDELPVCLDVELPRGIAGTGMTRAEIANWIISAWQTLQHEVGHAPMIYSSVRVLDSDDTDTFNGALNVLAKMGAPLWLARYDGQDSTVAPKAWGAGNYWIHQKLGDQRNYAAIHQVDVDAWNYAREGESGPRVRWIQERVGAPVTGMWLAATTIAVKLFQTAAGLPADGVIGPRTFARLAKTAGRSA